MQIVTPLSEATSQVLRPLTLHADSRIFIGMDGEDFLFECRYLQKNTAGEYVKGSVNRRLGQWVQDLPESKWLGAKDYKKEAQWKVAATDITAVMVKSCIPTENLRFTDHVAALTFKALWMRFKAQEGRAELQAKFKLQGITPDKPADWFDHPVHPLADYQRVACQMGLDQEGLALFMEQGTGKTATVIRRITMEAKRKEGMYRAIVVCPNAVRLNWEEEVAKFTTLAGKVTVIRGSETERVRLLVQAVTTEDDCEFSIVVIGYDSLSNSIGSFKRVNWDLAVLDESHSIKSSSTKRWKAILQLRDACKKRTILTGTPVGNSLFDLWTQLEFLGRGLSGFAKFSAYRQFYGVFINVDGHDKLTATKNVPLLQERLSRLSFTITKEDAGLHLPDKVYDTWECEMVPAQSKAYRALAEHLAAEIEDQLSGDVTPVEIEHILTKLLRLAQVTSGHVGIAADINPDTGETLSEKKILRLMEPKDNPKVQACVEMIAANDPKGKTLIWCNFVEDIKALQEAIPGAEAYYGGTSEKKREEIVKRFNGDDSLKVLILNPQCAGAGLNLLGYDENSDMYCNHEIFFSQNWSSILRGQAEDRAHRRGTRMPVRITDLCVPGTIDEEIRDRVQGKISMADALQDIRGILKGVLNG